MYVGWTDERVEQLIALWTEGRSASECAAIIGGFEHCADRGRSAICGKVHRLNLKPRTVATRAPRGSRPNYNYKSFDEINRTRKRHQLSQISTLERRIFGDPIGKGNRQIFTSSAPISSEPLPPVDTMPAQVSASELEPHHCRAIVAEHLPFNAERKIYCGERKIPGSSYCECHTRRYMTPVVVAKKPPASAPTPRPIQSQRLLDRHNTIGRPRIKDYAEVIKTT